MSAKHLVSRRKSIVALAVCGGQFAIATSVLATDYSWLGGGGNNNWNNAANWSSSDPDNFPPPPPNTPGPGDVTNLIFGGGPHSVGQTSTQNTGIMDVNSMVFSGSYVGAASISISASSSGDQFIRLGAGGIVGNTAGDAANAGTVVFTSGVNRKIILTADQEWSNTNLHGVLRVGRFIENDEGGNYTITKTGAGTLALEQNNNAWTGGWNIQDGFLRGSISDRAFGAGPITSITDNSVGLSASGSVNQVMDGPMTLGGTGTFAFRGSNTFILNGTLTLQNDKNMATNQPLTVNGTITGPGVFSKSGSGTLTLTSAANTHGGFVIDNGHLLFDSDAQLGAAGVPVGLSGGTLQPSTAIVSTRNLVPDSGGGTLNAGANNVTFANVDGEGNLRKYGSGALNVNRLRTGALTVVEGRVNVTAGASAGELDKVSVLGALDLVGGVTPTTTLDLTNNALIIDYTIEEPPPGPEAEPFDTIRAQIIHAYNNGAWDQPGITSSLANTSSHGVGYADVTQLFASFPATYLGQELDDTAVIARYTRYGDANLDGTINLADFNRLASNFGTASGATWADGDFNYDGVINLSDFNRLAANFGLQASAGGPTPDDWAALASAIPEPAGLGSVLGAGAALLARRRRTR